MSPLVRRISAWADPPTDRSLYPSIDVARARDDKRVPLQTSAREPRVGLRSAEAVPRDEREPSLSSVRVAPDPAQITPTASGVPVRVMGEARLRAEDPAAAGRRDPEFLEDHQPSASATVFWSSCALVLGLVMIVQLAVFFRNDLATTLPSTRGVLEQLCKPIGCEVGYVRKIDRIVIIGSSLQQVERKVDQKDNPYLLRLTLQNRNDHPQPWPSLLLSLSDASGTVIARRVISPEQYLPASLENGPFGSRQEVALEIPLSTQGLAVSGFELQRFFP